MMAAQMKESVFSFWKLWVITCPAKGRLTPNAAGATMAPSVKMPPSQSANARPWSQCAEIARKRCMIGPVSL